MTDSIERLAFGALTLLNPNGTAALRGVTFAFPPGQTFHVRGSSGSGKSLLLKLLGGLVEPSSGAYLINGRDVCGQSFEPFVPIQKRISFGFEFGGLLSNKTIRQNLMFPFFYRRDLAADEAEKRVEEYSRLFNLGSVEHLRPASCSGGRRKAACVARALLTRPELLLLDHPTAGLDEAGKRTLLELLARHRESHGLRHVFIVSDDEAFLARLDHLVLNIVDQELRLDMRAA